MTFGSAPHSDPYSFSNRNPGMSSRWKTATATDFRLFSCAVMMLQRGRDTHILARTSRIENDLLLSGAVLASTFAHLVPPPPRVTAQDLAMVVRRDLGRARAGCLPGTSRARRENAETRVCRSRGSFLLASRPEHSTSQSFRHVRPFLPTPLLLDWSSAWNLVPPF